MTLSSGDQVGPYTVVDLIGTGGMGEVYKAADSRLGRVVAIKKMRAADAARFRREARAIAALNHPHVCVLHDVGPDYLVMEYIEGEPLRGPVPPAEAVRLGLQIVSALEAAHARGIIHRDLKPNNLLLTRDGIKLLDFGIAKAQHLDPDATETAAGLLLGTPAYMSPEQAQVQPLDERSDIFSFGAVLYEMLQGEKAFPGASPGEVLTRILRDEPAPLRAPPDLQRVVLRCLRKAPQERFQTMTALKQALESLGHSAATPKPSVAVLPFANLSADKDNEYFSDGLAEEIINTLAHVPDLKVIARTSAFAFKGRQEDIRRIAEALGVTTVLEGSVRKSGNRLRITAQLISAVDGSHLWSERYDRELADVFAIQDEIAAAIASALRVELLGCATRQRPRTPKLSAYDSFLRGRHATFKHTPQSYGLALEYFQRAIQDDPEFAAPHVDLGTLYTVMGITGVKNLSEVIPLIRAAARKALALDPSEPGPEFLFGIADVIQDFNWDSAARHFQRALAGPTVMRDVHWAYASLYLQALGRFDESVAEMEKEVELDPLNAEYQMVLAGHINHLELYPRALEVVRRSLELDETLWSSHVVQAEAYLGLGRLEEAAAAGALAHQLAPWNSMPTAYWAAALVRLGRREQAESLMKQLGPTPTPLFGRAMFHLLCCEPDPAAAWYQKALEQREGFAIMYPYSPNTRCLRQSSHWPKLARMMNLPVTTDRNFTPELDTRQKTQHSDRHAV